MEPFANVWHAWSSWAYLKGYLETAGKAPFVPKSQDELKVLRRRLSTRESAVGARSTTSTTGPISSMFR